MIDNLKCYKLSKDYTRLKELLDKGYQVVCIVDYEFSCWDRGKPDYKPMMTRDICVARYFDSDNEDYKHYAFGVRGHGYGDYYPNYHKFSFEDFCKKALNLEFIEPTEDLEEKN